MKSCRLALLLFLLSCVAAALSPCLAAIYYVDSVSGSDGYSGLSPETAWRTLAKVNSVSFAPADNILFKSGCAWSGQLWPKGSGADSAPIVIASYGGGAKPIINGDGVAQEALLLYNQEYWEIGGLEITNYDPAGPEVNPYRQGVRVLGEDAGVLHHVYLRDLKVHDVNGSITNGRDQGKCNAGILFDVEGGSTPTHFNDVLIQGCYIHDCERSGIKLWSNWGRSCTQADPALHTNVVIRSNVVDNIAGDGINVHQTAGAVAEYNVVSRCCYWTEKANAALWTWASDDAIIQYNEVYQSMQTWDGMAFDIDGCSQRCVFQYNYSHDNWGGFLMIIGMPDCAGVGPYSKFCTDNHFRYNISQNDETRLLRFVGKIDSNYVYNNTIYVGSASPLIVESGPCGSPEQGPATSYVYNNIIYNTESPGSDYDLSDGTYFFDYNVFYGYHPAGEPADPHKLTSDPKFVAPGTSGLGRNTVGGYCLRPDSPCINSGMVIADNGGQDYWGNAVPTGAGPDRGAYEYAFATSAVLLEVHPNERAPGSSTGQSLGGDAYTRPAHVPGPMYWWKHHRFVGSDALWIQVCAQNWNATQNGTGDDDNIRMRIDGFVPVDYDLMQNGPWGAYQWKGDKEHGHRWTLRFLYLGLSPGPVLHALQFEADETPVIWWVKVTDLEPGVVEAF